METYKDELGDTKQKLNEAMAMLDIFSRLAGGLHRHIVRETEDLNDLADKLEDVIDEYERLASNWKDKEDE